MHFHLGWSGPARGFGHGGYYVEDDCYEGVGHQEERRAPRQENRMVRNPKPDGPVSPKTTAALGQQHR
jgi:hypothetical protein